LTQSLCIRLEESPYIIQQIARPSCSSACPTVSEDAESLLMGTLADKCMLTCNKHSFPQSPQACLPKAYHIVKCTLTVVEPCSQCQHNLLLDDQAYLDQIVERGLHARDFERSLGCAPACPCSLSAIWQVTHHHLYSAVHRGGRPCQDRRVGRCSCRINHKGLGQCSHVHACGAHCSQVHRASRHYGCAAQVVDIKVTHQVMSLVSL